MVNFLLLLLLLLLEKIVVNQKRYTPTGVKIYHSTGQIDTNYNTRLIPLVFNSLGLMYHD